MMAFAPATPWQPVLDFWFEDGLQHGWPSANLNSLWFRATAQIDAGIRERFGALVEAACSNELVDWEAAPSSRLALIVLLDQFTRHCYRGTAAAYSGDHRAVTLALEALARGFDQELPWVGRIFMLLPLMHAEDIDLQQQCVDRYLHWHDSAPAEIQTKIASHLNTARRYRDIIERFERFPHRNAILGRESSSAELAYLAGGER